MMPRSAATALAALLSAGASAADLSHLPAADAAPPEQRQRLVAADAAQASGDLALAYELLRAARAADAKLDPALAAAVDAERDSLAQRLADQLVADAKARMKEGHPALAEKLLTRALAYRASSADQLRAFYADPAVVAAVGGTDAVRARLEALEREEADPAELRWHLAGLSDDAPLETLDRQAARLALLRTFSGDADVEVIGWAHALARATAARVAHASELPASDERAARNALSVASAIIGASDPDIVAANTAIGAAHHREGLRVIGASEGAWSLRVGAWLPSLRGDFSARATPDTPSAGFANAHAGSSVSGSGLGGRLDVRWLREPSPTGPRSGAVWGGELALASATVDADLALADADTGGASLNGQRFKSHIGVTVVALQLVGGWRWALGDDAKWSVQARALGGAAYARESYGTRRGVVEGTGTDRTISTTGIASEFSAEVELAWRPLPRLAGIAALGFDALWLPSISSSDHGALIGASGTTSGAYSEDLSGLSAMGPYLLLGATYVF